MASIRRRLMTQREEGSILPNGYYPCEYIYSDGNAYIDTGYKHNNNTRVQMKAQAVGAITGNVFLFDGPNADGTRKGVFYQLSKNSWAVDYAKSTARQYLSAGANDMLEIDFDKNVCTINGETKTFTASTFQSTVNLTLLCSNFGGTPQSFIKAKLYHCAIWDNDVLVRDYVPCINESNVYGLYDLVNRVFYQSAGASQFGEVPVVYDFAYTGGEQIAQLESGTYKLECWGAQGGAGGIYTANGGKGGYSVGVLNLKDSTTLYINVGGKGGGNGKPIYENNGGYNGGGKSGEAISSECYPGGGGGGATHIATKTGLLTSLTSFQSDILIVAGGGGGGGGVGSTEDYWEDKGWVYQPYDANEVKGGDGGGSSASDGSSYIISGSEEAGKGGQGGKTSSSGSGGGRGIGEEFDEEDLTYISGSGGGGGGGYYGGGGGGSGAVSGISAYDGNNGNRGSFGKGGNGARAEEHVGWSTSCGGGGGGGSAYLSPLLTSASSTSGERSGNGYARITKI